jgi:hypothetical protein
MKIQNNMVVRLIRNTCYSNTSEIRELIGKPVIVTHTRYCSSCLKDHAYIKPIGRKTGFSEDLDIDCFMPVNTIPVKVLETKSEMDMREERLERERQQNEG